MATMYINCSNGEYVNCRKGAGTSYDIKYYLPHGEKVSTSTVSGSWTKITPSDYSNKGEAWVQTSFLSTSCASVLHNTQRRKELNGLLRDMTDSDTEKVLSILKEAIIEGNSTSRYVCPTKEEWEDSLIRECCYVYEENDEVLGFVVLHPFSKRPCYCGVAEISIYIASKARGRGVGKLLLQKEIDESEKHGFWSLTSNIYITNEASCRLHEALGFRKVGYRDRLMKTINGEWMSVVIYELRRHEE